MFFLGFTYGEYGKLRCVKVVLMQTLGVVITEGVWGLGHALCSPPPQRSLWELGVLFVHRNRSAAVRAVPM